MTSTRRAFLAGTAALVAAAATTGCSLLQNDPVPYEPFGPFIVRETGGVDGRNIPLMVSTDGVALLLGHEPAAGQLSEKRMVRLRELLESEDLRREAANPPNDSDDRCSDQIGVSLEMGSLQIGRTQSCGSGVDAPRTFGEILRLLEDARSGDFDAPVTSADPALVPVRLERSGSDDEDEDYVIALRADGTGEVTERGRTTPTRDLEPEQHDALRLLLDRLPATVPSPSPSRRPRCEGEGRWVLQRGDDPAIVLPDCSAQPPSMEILAVVALLEDVA